jgi:Ca2+-binding RTX toxin-like protein
MSRSQSRRGSRAPLLEGLEERRLFAAAPGDILVEASKLDIEGTRRADVIVIDLNTSTGLIDVTINGVLKGSLQPNQISAGIECESGPGNDSITVGAGITLEVEVDGDKGNDTIVGGSGEDELKGGPGKDSISGGAGEDDIEGEAGNDVLGGGAGEDHIDGGNGKDTINGDDDSDILLGGTGKDNILGGAGNDRLRGENGKDTCDGGDGNDDIDGGQSRDNVTGGPGTDDFNQAVNANRRGRGGDNITDLEAGEDDAADNITADQVPAAVTAAFNTRYPGATINEIELDQEDLGPVYKFDFNAGPRRMRAWFDQAGTLVGEEVR